MVPAARMCSCCRPTPTVSSHPDWATEHRRPADAGVDAAAGMVELAGQSLTPPVVARHATVFAYARRSDGHGNVYAANLSVRADAYLAVGGSAQWRAARIMRSGNDSARPATHDATSPSPP
jgi:hypothetical protein